jgi:hypothetical protein
MITIKDNASAILDEIEVIFMGIKEYESQNNYHISLKNTYKWLVYPTTKYTDYIDDSKVRETLKEYLDVIKLVEGNDMNDLRGNYIMKNIGIGKIKAPVFSVNGFKLFCMAQDDEKAMNISRYFARVEKKYWNALHAPEEERLAELTDLKERVKTSSKSIGNICSEIDNYMGEIMCLKDKYENLRGLQESVKDIKSFTESGDNEYKSHLYLVKTHFKEVPVYTVNPVLIHGEWKYKEDENPFNLYTENDIGRLDSDESPVLYYHIGELDGRKKNKSKDDVDYHFVTYHYVENIAHLEKLKTFLNSNERFVTSDNSTYLISFVNIKKYSNEVLMNNEFR